MNLYFLLLLVVRAKNREENIYCINFVILKQKLVEDLSHSGNNTYFKKQ